VRHRIALGQPLIGEVKLSVLAAVPDVEKAPVPVRRKGKLHVKADSPRDRSLDVAVFRGRAGGGLQRRQSDREIRHRGDPLAGRRRERGLSKRLLERQRARITHAERGEYHKRADRKSLIHGILIYWQRA